MELARADFFWVRSCLSVKSDSVPICTETFSIFQEILRAKSDAGASMQFDRRPMALQYPYGRRFEAARADAPRAGTLSMAEYFLRGRSSAKE
jgi:hypothetical protein